MHGRRCEPEKDFENEFKTHIEVVEVDGSSLKNGQIPDLRGELAWKPKSSATAKEQNDNV